MPTTATRQRHGSEAGTASIELIAVVPLLLLAALAAAQIAAVGHTAWSAAIAARAGARAALVDGDTRRVAIQALPKLLRDGAAVEGDERVSVAVTVPRLWPALPALKVGATSGLGRDG